MSVQGRFIVQWPAMGGASNESEGVVPRRPGRVELIDATGRLSPEDARWIADHAVRAMRVLEADGEVRVRVVGDAEMAAAHLEYAEVEGTTDVLTFDMSEPNADGTRMELDVDVLACLDEAGRQAERRSHPARCELLLYVVHGMLHCLGFDDHDDDEYARMHAEEDRVLEAIGVGSVFGGASGAGAESGATGEGPR